MKHLDSSTYLQALADSRKPFHNGYYAMYSSLLDAVVTDPLLMQLPIDDHLVHRGDGVFETAKCVNGAIYNFDAHLDRLIRSAAAIGMAWPGGPAEIKALTRDTVRAGGRRDCSVRVILARGPGSFGISPYEPPAMALYIIIYAASTPFMQRHPEGATVRRSLIPPKQPPFAGFKNCNYLPNVLMKREAQDWGVDFTVGFDAAGHLTEGATENAAIITRAGALRFPRLESILAGTTMLRLVELAGVLRAEGRLTDIAYGDISEPEIFDAAEMLIVGTSLNVVSVRSYEGRAIGESCPGPLGVRLGELLDTDITRNPERRLEMFTNGCRCS